MGAPARARELSRAPVGKRLCQSGGCTGPLLAGFSLNPGLYLSELSQEKGQRNATCLSWHSVRKKNSRFLLPRTSHKKMRMRWPLLSILREEGKRGTGTINIPGGKARKYEDLLLKWYCPSLA